jgi:hypothetical protein
MTSGYEYLQSKFRIFNPVYEMDDQNTRFPPSHTEVDTQVRKQPPADDSLLLILNQSPVKRLREGFSEYSFHQYDLIPGSNIKLSLAYFFG